MTRFTIYTHPGLKFMSLNDRDHHMTKAGKTKKWIAATQAELTKLHLQPLGAAHIHGAIFKPNKRKYDPHNLFPTMKAIIDGIVRYDLPGGGHIIPDDDYRHVTATLDHGGVDPTQTSHIVITITEREAHE